MDLSHLCKYTDPDHQGRCLGTEGQDEANGIATVMVGFLINAFWAWCLPNLPGNLISSQREPAPYRSDAPSP